MGILKFLQLGRLKMTILVITVVATASFSIGLPLTFGLIVDTLLPFGLQEHVTFLCLGLLALIVLRFGLHLIQDILFQKIRMDCERDVTQRYVSHALKNPDQAASKTNPYLRLWLVNFQYQFTEILFFFAYAVFIATLVFAVIIVIDKAVAGICAFFLVLHAINFLLHRTRSERAAAAYSKTRTHFTESAHAVLLGKRSVNIAGVEHATFERISGLSDTSLEWAAERERIAASQGFVQSLLRGALILLIVLLTIPKIEQGSLHIGALFSILLMINFAYEPIYRLNALTKLWSQLISYLEPLAAFFKLTSTTPSNDRAMDHPQLDAIPVKVENLTVKNDDALLFDKFSATFAANALTLIRGRSGGGKSTLLKLISSITSPVAGSVIWGDHTAATLAQGDKAQLMHYMPQAPVFFDESLDCNISLFEPNPDRQRIDTCLASLGFTSDQIQRLRSHFRPSDLSLGQRQRLGLARGLYSITPILVLDEPTANLDADTEQRCMGLMKREAQTRTVILVSHTRSAIDVADSVISLDEFSGND